MAGPKELPDSGYVAFISYSREDEAFAKQLETEIEAYQRPGSATSARIFRDRSDFTGNAYESALDAHLHNSKSLIVLCSPHARKSAYVGDEIKRFAKHHGTERIFPILVSGLPDNEADDKKAFPPALMEVMHGRGMPLGAEYRGLDPRRERLTAGRFEGEWYKLLGNIYDATPAEIQAEDTKRQVRIQRRRALAAGVAVLVLIGLLGVNFVMWRRALRAEQLADEMSAKATTELALQEKAAVVPAAEPPVAVPPPAEPTAGAAAPEERLPARVYVHVRNEQQREIARRWAPALTDELARTGLTVVVPPIDILDVGPTKHSELRYFRDAERADADRIAQALRAKVPDLEVKKVPGYEASTKIRARHYELWLKPAGAPY